MFYFKSGDTKISKRILGVVPKSGEKMPKDAIGQFKGIISQIQAGAKKVRVKLTANEKKVEKINIETARLTEVMSEALVAADNLEAILSKKVLTEDIPTDKDAETVEDDKAEENTSDEKSE